MTTRMEAKDITDIVLGFLSAVGSLGTLFFFVLPRTFNRRPTYGPRLEKGEVTAGQATSAAEEALWKAEEAAAKGRCDVARRNLAKADIYRHMAKTRTAKGDRTGRDIRNAVRNARREMRKCAVKPR